MMAFGNGLDPTDIATTAIHEAEILQAIACLPTGPRQEALGRDGRSRW